jgi:hypothetical protein
MSLSLTRCHRWPWPLKSSMPCVYGLPLQSPFPSRVHPSQAHRCAHQDACANALSHMSRLVDIAVSKGYARELRIKSREHNVLYMEALLARIAGDDIWYRGRDSGAGRQRGLVRRRCWS